jgi:hypothetical protein
MDLHLYNTIHHDTTRHDSTSSLMQPLETIQGNLNNLTIKNLLFTPRYMFMRTYYNI